MADPFRLGLSRPRLLVLGLSLAFALAYAFFNLHSAWNPAQRLAEVRAGLVDEDQPVSADGSRVAVGEDLKRTLLEAKNFGWRELTRAEAEARIRAGTLDFYLHIPPDASRRVVGLPTAASPEQPILSVYVDPAYNYPMNQVADSVAATLRQELNGKVASTYLDKLLGGVDGAMRQVAVGAGEVADGARQIRDGNSELSGGLDRAAAGAAALADGASQIRTGSAALVDGYRQLADGQDRLTAGLGQAVDGVRQIRSGVEESLARKDPVLADAGAQIEKSMKGLALRRPYLLMDRDYQNLMFQLKRLGARADLLQRDGVASLAGALGQLESGLEQARDGSRQLSAGARMGHQQGQALVTGAGHLADGAARLSAGVAEAGDGARRLADGAGRLADGAARLADGTARAVSGGGDGALPPRANADEMSQPVKVVSAKVNPLPKPGEALIGLVLPIALWIGALALVYGARLFGGGWGTGESGIGRLRSMAAPGLALAGTISGIALLMGPRVEHPALFVVMAALATFAFVAVNQMLVHLLGLWGFAVSVLLLILMPVAVGARAPYVLLPAVYKAVAPFLPLTHAIRGVQSTVAGGAWDIFWVSAAALFVLLVLSLWLSRFQGRAVRLSP